MRVNVKHIVTIMTIFLAWGKSATARPEFSKEMVSISHASLKRYSESWAFYYVPTQIIDPEELRNFTLPNLHLYENWVDWENWESTEETRKSFPYYRSGYDEDGLVGKRSLWTASYRRTILIHWKCFAVYVMEFGKWNYRALTHLSPEQIEDFWMYYEQCARRAERDSALRKNGGNVFLLDWDGFSLANYASGPGKYICCINCHG